MRHKADGFYYISRNMLASDHNHDRMAAIKRVCGGKKRTKIPITATMLLDLSMDGEIKPGWLLHKGAKKGRFTKDEVDKYWSAIAAFVRATEGQRAENAEKWEQKAAQIGITAFMDVLYQRAKREGLI